MRTLTKFIISIVGGVTFLIPNTALRAQFDTDEFEERDRLLAEADGSLPNIPHLGWDISKYGKYGLTLGGDLGGNVVCLDRAAAQTMLSKYVVDYGPQRTDKFIEGLEKTKCQQFNGKIEINSVIERKPIKAGSDGVYTNYVFYQGTADSGKKVYGLHNENSRIEHNYFKILTNNFEINYVNSLRLNIISTAENFPVTKFDRLSINNRSTLDRYICKNDYNFLNYFDKFKSNKFNSEFQISEILRKYSLNFGCNPSSDSFYLEITNIYKPILINVASYKIYIFQFKGLDIAGNEMILTQVNKYSSDEWGVD